MTEKNETREFVNKMLAAFSGQGNTLTIPRPYIEATGSVELALFLSQVVYWSDRTTMADGWFAKSYAEWTKEIALSKYQIVAAVKKLKEAGIETVVKKFKGAPTVHYRLRKDVFAQWIVKKLDEPGKERNLTIESEETSQSSTETTTETIIKSSAVFPDLPIEKPVSVPDKVESKPEKIPAILMNPMKDAIVLAFGWKWETMTKAEKGIVQTTAKELCTVHVSPERIPALYDYCRMRFKTFSPRCLSSHLSDFLKSRLGQSNTPKKEITPAPALVWKTRELGDPFQNSFLTAEEMEVPFT